jgi:hypothetical protein
MYETGKWRNARDQDCKLGWSVQSLAKFVTTIISTEMLSDRKCKPLITAERTTCQSPFSVTHVLILWLLTSDYWLLTTDYWLLTTDFTRMRVSACMWLVSRHEHFDRFLCNLHWSPWLNRFSQFQCWCFLLIFCIAFSDSFCNKVTEHFASFHRFTSENLRYKIVICLILKYLMICQMFPNVFLLQL